MNITFSEFRFTELKELQTFTVGGDGDRKSMVPAHNVVTLKMYHHTLICVRFW